MQTFKNVATGVIGDMAKKSTFLLTRPQAASYLGIKPNTLAVWACTNRYHLPYAKIGSRVFYKQSDLDAFIANNTIDGGGNV